MGTTGMRDGNTAGTHSQKATRRVAPTVDEGKACGSDALQQRFDKD